MSERKNEIDDSLDVMLKKKSYQYEKGFLKGVLMGLVFALVIAAVMYTTQPIP